MNTVIEFIKKHVLIVRYIISGGAAAAVDIAFLYLFSDIFKWWYITSAVLAFLIAFGVSFGLQKFWTFRDHSMEGVHKQASLYLLVAVGNLIINTFLMYLFVDVFHIWYIFSRVVCAQILAGGLIALMSFFIYRKYIFN